MKKFKISFAVVVFLFAAVLVPMYVFAESGDLPMLSFSNSSEKVYGGTDFAADVELSKEADYDIIFNVTDNNGKKAEGIIKAGEKTGKVNLKAADKEGERLTYTIESGNGFSLGTGTQMNAVSYNLPKFKLSYEGIKYIKVGDKFEVKIKRSSKDAVVKDILFTVRLGSEKGEVVREVTLPQWSEQVTLKIENTKDWGREADLYVCIDQTDAVVGKLNVIMGNVNDRGIRSIETDQKKIAISFDCAYGDEYVDYILDLLDEYNIKTTFFVTGFWVKAHPDTLKKIYERGHEIGNHSMNHPELTTLSDARIFDELNSVSNMVEDITGVRPKVFRPPYGNYSARVVGIASTLGCDTILWAYDSMDWQERPKYNYIISNATKDVKAGDIILFHAAAELTKETLPVILEYYTKELGVNVVRVSDLVYDGDRTVSKEGMVTPGNDYANYSGDKILAVVGVENVLANIDVPDSAELTFKFDENKWFLHNDEVAKIKSEMDGVEISVSLTEDIHSAPVGASVGTAVFSYYGQPDITADIVLNSISDGSVSDGDAENNVVSVSDIMEQEEKAREDTKLSVANVLAAVSVLSMVVVAIVLFIKKKTK